MLAADSLSRLSPREATPKTARRPLLRFQPILAPPAEESFVSAGAATGSSSFLLESSSSGTSAGHPAGEAHPRTVATPAPSPPPRVPEKNNAERSVGPGALDFSHDPAPRGQDPTQPLSEDELMCVQSAHQRYMDSISQPGCLLILLQELASGDSLSECEWWLQQLEKFLSLSRDELAGSGLGERAGDDRALGKHHRVLTQEEVVCFLTELKKNYGSVISPRLKKNKQLLASSGGTTSRGLDENDLVSSDTWRGKHSSADQGITDGCGRSSFDTRPSSMVRRDNNSSTSRTTRRVTSEAIVTSARSYLLERKTFAGLGGGEDGSGTIRLLDLKRMLQAFHFTANFEECVGRVIDTQRTGMITFSEFLWILEFGVRGDGPAAAMHEFLAAPVGNKTPMPGTAASRAAGRPVSRASQRTQQKTNHDVGMSALKRGDGTRLKAAAGTKQRPVSRSDGRQRKTTVGTKQNLFARILRMSPYASTVDAEPRACHSARGRQGCTLPRRRVSTRPKSKLLRLCSSRANSAEAPVSRRLDFRNKRTGAPLEKMEKELHFLQAQQSQLTAKLKAVTTGLPVGVSDAQKRQEQLHCIQEELNAVLDRIATTLKGMVENNSGGKK